MKLPFLRTVLIMVTLSLIYLKADAGSIQNYWRKIIGESYSLMETCIKQEESTKNRLKSRSVDPRIWNYCKKIVGESYSLMETCIKQEESAKNRLKSNSFERSNVPNRSIRTDDIKSIPQSYIPSPSDYYKVVHRSSANNIKKSEIQKIEKLISKYAYNGFY